MEYYKFDTTGYREALIELHKKFFIQCSSTDTGAVQCEVSYEDTIDELVTEFIDIFIIGYNIKKKVV
jgi:hypothetical protein